MANYSTNEFKAGLKILIDGDPYAIVENEMVKPGKGQAFNRVRVRNLKTGRTIERTWKSGDTVEAADVVDTDMQYLYREGDFFNFMVPDTYEQLTASKEAVGEGAFGLARGRADHPGAEVPGDLDRRRAHAAGTADCQHPVPGFYVGPVGQHVHGRAAREGQRGRGFKIHARRQRHQRPRRHQHLLREPAVLLNAEQLAVQAQRFLATGAEFARAAEQVRLHGHAVAGAPVRHAGTDGRDFAGGLAAERPRQLHRHGQSRLLEPEVKPVQPAGPDADNDFLGSRCQVGQVAQFEPAGLAMSDELERFHPLGNGGPNGQAETARGNCANDLRPRRRPAGPAGGAENGVGFSLEHYLAAVLQDVRESSKQFPSEST